MHVIRYRNIWSSRLLTALLSVGTYTVEIP